MCEARIPLPFMPNGALEALQCSIISPWWLKKSKETNGDWTSMMPCFLGSDEKLITQDNGISIMFEGVIRV